MECDLQEQQKVYFLIIYRVATEDTRLQKGDNIRFGKILYKIKYMSLVSDKEKGEVKKNKLARKKIMPLNQPKEGDTLYVDEEEAKMLQESLANNSAMAATIDPDLRSHRATVMVQFNL